jgi:beta-lactamase regulating signal transducer with metallopeptidase domain
VNWVWEASLSAAVLIALGWLVIACFGNRLPAWARYGIWLLVFLRLMVPVVPKAGFSVWNLREVLKADTSVRQPPAVVEQPEGYKPALQQVESQRYERRVPVISLVWFGGMLTCMIVAVVRHRRLSRWVRQLAPCKDKPVLSMVDRAQAAFGVRKSIAVLIDNRFGTPAVFGWKQPSVLLPQTPFNEQELYGVLLHEIAHVKCRDGLFNWVWIFVRSVHWFNPLVWYAFRRLRAERELFCDALVLKRLQPPERAVYGNMLLTISTQLSGQAAPLTLTSILQQKPEIHRRIHMIAKYKSTPWLLSAAFTLLLIALAGITFTRAAERKAPPGPAAPAAAVTPAASTKALDLLKDELDKQEAIVRHLQKETSKMAEKLEPAELSGADTLQKLALVRVDVNAEVVRLSSLYKQLMGQNRAELRQTIGSALPDNQLSQLMQQLDMAQQKLADLIEDRAPEHPDVKRTKRVLAQINIQIESRIDGIVSGLKARIAAEEAHLDALGKELDQARARYVERSQRNRPYQESLQELRAQEEILQRLRLRMVQERIDIAIEGGREK